MQGAELWMAFTFDNLIFNRIILHNVYKPNDEGRVNPFPSRELTQLVGAGLDKLQQRISSVLGNGSHSLQMVRLVAFIVPLGF